MRAVTCAGRDHVLSLSMVAALTTHIDFRNKEDEYVKGVIECIEKDFSGLIHF